MTLTGGCYCGDVRYEVDGEPTMRAQCHCRECQYITGGGPNYFMMVPEESLRFTAGEPASYTRDDIANPVTRLFCPRCGTHLATKLPNFPSAVLKVGSLDDPAAFGEPQMAIFTSDMQPFHLIPEGIPQFERTPG